MELEQLIDKSGFKLVIYQPEDAWGEFDEFSEVLFDRDLTLIIDDAFVLQSPQKAHDGLEKWIRWAPLESTDVLMTLHAPADSYARCRSLATHWYLFRTWRPADVDAVRDHCGEEVAARIQTLPRHHYIHFDVSEVKMTVHDKPEEWFVDLKGKGVTTNA